MRKSTLIGMGIGVVAGVVTAMCIKKTIKNKPIEEQRKIINKTKDVATDMLFAAGISAIISSAVNAVDNKVRMNAVVETLHYHHTGFFDEETSKYAITTLFPTLSRKTKKAVYPLIQEVFPDLVEVR